MAVHRALLVVERARDAGFAHELIAHLAGLLAVRTEERKRGALQGAITPVAGFSTGVKLHPVSFPWD